MNNPHSEKKIAYYCLDMHINALEVMSPHNSTDQTLKSVYKTKHHALSKNQHVENLLLHIKVSPQYGTLFA